MCKLVCTFVLLLLFSLGSRDCSTTVQNDKISFNSVQGWAVKLGTELYHFGEFITRKKEVQDSFKSAQIESRDGEKLVQSMADDIRAMMELKISAVKRIVEAAENMAFDKQSEPVPEDYQFYNSKEMDEPYDDVSITTTAEPDFTLENWIVRPPTKSAHLQLNAHFYNIPVNTNFSSVHVPTNVYAWADEVIKGIHWSEGLDTHFINNYQSDPTLSWQYFGSSTGFMRHYPAMKWRADPVDIYDCRTRAWYMEAAASPKDVVILVDRSGSMTGQRRDISKHVVTNILDTLGNNDFVNVMTFADTVEEIVPCFEDSLVQATMGNLRELKLGLDNFETKEIANFSAALTRAFELLEIYRNNSGGANCNQAIMLVTDGVPYNYKELFEKYNWKYDTPVRVFTYLIGREVADVREVKWMACANRGFYVHLSTLAEVRERVLEHVNVLARPLVLQRETHPVVWTPVYANITDPKVADYLWEQRERAEQKERFMSQRRDKSHFNSEKEQERRWRITQMKQGQYSELGNSQYQLMTSVSMPVYDLRHNENITENVLINEAYWVSVTKEHSYVHNQSQSVEENGQKEMRIARLLGVAGTDVALSEMQALMTPYKIGVNGYAFIVTNNGYILIHPDLRPVFQQILKPSYNSVDMIEVELFDDDRGPRNFSKELTALRQEIIDQKTGNKLMNVKYHMDDMKRASRGKKHYYWTGISESPFTLVVAIPENYGRHRITPPPTDDIHRVSLTTKNISAQQYLNDRWSVHPDWLYCRHYERSFSSPEEELSYFLERVARPGWRWPAKPRPPEHHKNKPAHERHNGTSEGRERTKASNSTPRNEYYCDHGLMQALLYDARNTAWFNKSISESASEEKAPLTKVIGLLPRAEFIQRFGYIVAFLATHSGLTRWQTHPPKEHDNSNDSKSEFGKKYPRAIDEAWYRRAVEQHYVDPLSYVYSVEMSTDKFPLNVSVAVVTAAHAVFHGDGHRKAPAAVVGFQFRHDRLSEWFNNITSSCEHKEGCKTCASENWDCYLVDNNGWVIVSEDDTQTGQFFGKIRPDVMSMLVEEEVYKTIHIMDYQAVCFREKKTTNPASILLTPLENLRLIMAWFLATSVWLYNSIAVGLAQGTSYFDEEYVTPTVSYTYENDEETDDPFKSQPPTRIIERDFEKMVLINRTRPTPCDREMFLYQLEYNNLDEKLNKPAKDCERPFYAQLVNYTNMLLVVVDGNCPREDAPVLSVDATEVQYNGTLQCLKHVHPLYRKQPVSCIRNHPEESNIDMCGRGSIPERSVFWIPLTMVMVFRYF
ncbi:voltage-dependent calcium channel subunit straightjacket isoform X2 [Choristoneura fumiferana]|uniref:voltage-dependent calcium channel subunit straightjacket isoform X2 n=1 Tax=Choristoneura fumiferana TaxID=7141 RepID=UPI003D15A8EF